MLYLIGGAPRVGKSIIAKQLMKETGAPWLSTDVLRSVLCEVTQEALRKQYFPYAGATDNDVVFAEPINVIIQQQITEARSMKIGLEKFMQHQLDVHDDFILEGVHLLPEQVANFYKQYPRLKDQMKVLFIVDNDVENVLKGIQANTSHFDWLVGAKPNTFKAVAEFVAQFSSYMEKEVEKYEMLKFVKTDNFEMDIKHCLEMLSQK